MNKFGKQPKQLSNQQHFPSTIPTAQASSRTHSAKTHEQLVADYVLGFLRTHSGLVAITSGIGSGECVKCEDIIRQPVRGPAAGIGQNA